MTRSETYWLGYRAGRRLAEHDPGTDHEARLRLEVRLSGGTHRAFALGELRGYRQAAGYPYDEAHRVLTAGETLHPLVRARWEQR